MTEVTNSDPNEVPAQDEEALNEYLREVAAEGLDDFDSEDDDEV